MEEAEFIKAEKCGEDAGGGGGGKMFKVLPIRRSLLVSKGGGPPTANTQNAGNRFLSEQSHYRVEEEEKGEFLLTGSRQEAGEEDPLAGQEARDDDDINTRKQRKRTAHLDVFLRDVRGDLAVQRKEQEEGEFCAGYWKQGGMQEQPVLLQNPILTDLPLDLVVQKVLPCLPLPKIFELRCVAHTWNSLLCSQPVLQQCIAAQQKNQPWLVMARKSPGNNCFARDFIAYVPSLGRYFPFPFHLFPQISSLLGSHLDCLLYYIKYPMEHTPAGFHMTSAGGLICCFISNVAPELRRGDDEFNPGHSFTLLVFNPLTGHMKILPPIDGFGFENLPSVCLSKLHNQVDNSYKIFISDHLKWRHFNFIYDSKTGCWKYHHLKFSGECGNVQNADFYRLVGSRENRFSVLHGYHMESDTWSSLSVPRPCGLQMPFFLQKVNGRVLLASSFRPAGAPAALQGFTLWELEYTPSVGGRWVQLAKTPSVFWIQFYNPCNLPFSDDTSYVTNRRLICMTAVDFLDRQYGGNYASPLIYDLALKSWYQLPPYKGGTGFMVLFTFEPTLNIPM